MVDRTTKHDRPTLGVVIPTVGDRVDLKRMLESIVDQTRPVQAIRIVVDAEDTTLVEGIIDELSDRLATIDVQILVTGAKREEGAYLVETGYGYAVNRGLERLDTDLVAFLDDDDEILPIHFERLEAALDVHGGHSVAYARVTVINPDGVTTLFPEGAMPEGRIPTVVLIDAHPVLLPATLIHRTALESVVSLDESFDRLADTDMVVRLGLATMFSAVDQPSYVYHRVSRKTVIRARLLTETAELLRKHRDQLTKRQRMFLWDVQVRTAIRGGHIDLARKAAGEVVSVIWPNPPDRIAGWYLWLRNRNTPGFVKWFTRRVIVPLTGKNR
jgi:glycosyltransferase involved in cell wall biosynthesis